MTRSLRRQALLDTTAVAIPGLLFGLLWLVQDPSRTDGLYYEGPRALLDFLPFDAMRGWGGLLLVAKVAFIGSLVRRHEPAARVMLTVLLAYWSFWCINGCLTIPDGRSYTTGLWAVFAVILHWKMYRDIAFICRDDEL